MSGDEDGDVLLIAQHREVLPEVAPGAGIEAGGGFVEQQDAGMMQQSFGQFEAALHAAGESLDAFLGAIRQADAAEHFLNALFQGGPAQAVKMSLMPQILGGRELDVDALGLEDDADLAAQAAGSCAASQPMIGGAAAAGNHQRGENAKQRGLAAAIGPEQAEQFCGAHVEGDAVQRGAVPIAMDQILYGNNGRAEAGVTSGAASAKAETFEAKGDSK